LEFPFVRFVVGKALFGIYEFSAKKRVGLLSLGEALPGVLGLEIY
jgi:hypothetical protein